MKKNLGKILIVIATISCVFLFIAIINNKKLKRPDYDYTAIIYHDERLGMDAGTGYTYHIYKSLKSDNKYFYIKSKSKITIAGAEVRDIDSGTLNDKNDLKKIMKDIKKDSKKNKNSQTHISYSYLNNGNREEIENINELEKILFK